MSTEEPEDFLILENFCSNNIDTLIQITITERKSKGFGALFMEVNHKEKKVDCRFIDREVAYKTPDLKEIYENLQENARPSFAFFVLVTYDSQTGKSKVKILNVDLDKKS